MWILEDHVENVRTSGLLIIRCISPGRKEHVDGRRIMSMMVIQTTKAARDFTRILIRVSGGRGFWSLSYN